MKPIFIQLVKSKDTEFLLKHHPNAFLLLTLISYRARRTANEPDGLQVGDALIGDFEECGLSRQQYRTALEKLVEFCYIEIIHNGKKFLKREKSTIKVTITGTLVNLLNSRVYNINPETTNQHDNQRATNEQPTSNHEQERTIKKKKIYLSDSIEIGLATYFFNKIRGFKDNFKEPNMQGWAEHFDYLIRLDKRTPEEIRKLIDWVVTDSFNRKNVLSPAKLRERWDNLELNSKEKTSNKNKGAFHNEL